MVRSQGSVDIEGAQATRRGVSLSLGIFGFTFWVRPVFDIHIGALTLNDVSAAAIERLRLEGLSAPVTIRGVMLGELQLEQLCRIRSSRVYRFLKVISSEPSTEV